MPAAILRLGLFAPLLFLAASLLSFVPQVEAGSQLSCRRCECNTYITGNTRDGRENVDALFNTVTDKVTGGDRWTWKTVPSAATTFIGSMHVPRLCGNGEIMNHDWYFNQWPGGSTKVRLECFCEKSVKCLGGSKCENSEI